MNQFYKSKWMFVGIGLLVLGGLVSFFLFFSTSDEGEQAIEFEENRRNGDDPLTKHNRTMSMANMDQMIQRSEVASPDVLLAQYKMYYRYPPQSRPLTKNMHDLIDPFTSSIEKTPVLNADGKAGAHYNWFSPKYMITANETMTGTLEILDEEGDNRVKPRILTAEIISDPILGEKVVGRVDYNDSGTNGDKIAGDNIYTFSWKPHVGDKSNWGDLTMRIKFDAPNFSGAEIAIGFHSTSSIPAEFTGNYDERIEDGSLILSIEMDVKKAGEYVIEGNLHGMDDDQPYHWVYTKKYLNQGTQIVDILLFGAIFYDRNFEEGKFALRNLRGHRMNLPYDPRRLDAMLASGQEVPETFEPLQEWMPIPKKPLVTRKSYTVLQFSPDEYKGADKEERLQVIREYAADWEKAHGATAETSLDD